MTGISKSHIRAVLGMLLAATSAVATPQSAHSEGSPSRATVTIGADDPAPTVQFALASAAGLESTTPAVIGVSLSAASGRTVTVDYATGDAAVLIIGVATPGSDFTPTSGTLTFDPGVTSRTIDVPIVNDTVFEGDEIFTVALTTPVNATLGANTVHTHTITDDDVAGSIRLGSATYAVGEAGPAVTIVVTRAGGSVGACGVSYSTANGTGSAGSDYTRNFGMLSWASGDTANKTFTVPIVNDALDEPDETFTVTLAEPTGGAALGAPGSATVTITDDDPPPAVQFNHAAASGLESKTPATIKVSLPAASGKTVTVNYATADGTASAGRDYTATSGTLTFTPGVTFQTINVPITNDTDREPDETFTVTLTSPVNATLGAISRHTSAIYDDGVPGIVGLNTIAAAVDLDAWTCTTTVGANWWLQTAVTHDGADAARSGFVADNQASSFQTTGSFGAGTVSFWWKVSSEPLYDTLRFLIDGVVRDTISGEIGWHQRSHPVTAGNHTLKWEYSKDSVYSKGIDAAWVDQIELPAALVLWTRGDSGEAVLWAGNSGARPGARTVTDQTSLTAPSRDGGPWEAVGCTHADTSTDYVLWSRGDTGQAILAKVDAGASPGTDPIRGWAYLSSPAEDGGRWQATSYSPGPGFAGDRMCSGGRVRVSPVPVDNIFGDRTPAVEKGRDAGCAGNPRVVADVREDQCERSEAMCSPVIPEDHAQVADASGEYEDVFPEYVLWTRGGTGQAILAKVAPGAVSGAIPVTSWAYLDGPTDGGLWQATSYTHVDDSTGYVLWSCGDTGQAILGKVAPGAVSGTIPVTSWAYLQTPTGAGERWHATSYTHVDASEAYLLWSHGDAGQAILAKIAPGGVSGMIPTTTWAYISSAAGAGWPWRATSYIHGATPGPPNAPSLREGQP